MIDRTNAYEQAILAYDAEPSKPCEAILAACDAFLAALLADPATCDAIAVVLVPLVDASYWGATAASKDAADAVLRVLGTDQ